MTEGNIFSLSTLAGRGYPILPTWRGYPILGLDSEGVPHPRSGWWGAPIPGMDREVTPSQVWIGGTPILLMGVHPSKTRMGGVPCSTPYQAWMVYPPVQDWMRYPFIQDWMGYPPTSGDRSAQQALARRWVVCLLRSRKRTFLFLFCSEEEVKTTIFAKEIHLIS